MSERRLNRHTHCRYTVTASKRAEHRRLYTFIRLTEYIIYDELHNLVLNSTLLILKFVTPQLKVGDR